MFKLVKVDLLHCPIPASLIFYCVKVSEGKTSPSSYPAIQEFYFVYIISCPLPYSCFPDFLMFEIIEVKLVHYPNPDYYSRIFIVLVLFIVHYSIPASQIFCIVLKLVKVG